MDAISRSRSDNVYRFSVSLLVNLGKFTSFRFKADSITSGLPFLSSNLSNTFFKASAGFLAFAILIIILCACLVKSGPSHFNSRSNSSLWLTPRSRDMITKEDFYTVKDSGWSLNTVKREGSKLFFIRKRQFNCHNIIVIVSNCRSACTSFGKNVLAWGFNCVFSVIESCKILSKSAQGLGTVIASVDRGANCRLTLGFSEHADDISSRYWMLLCHSSFKFSTYCSTRVFFIRYWNVKKTIS